MMSVGELTSKYRTKEHFVEAYTRYGRLLPLRTSFGWGYVKQVMCGEKLLIDKKDGEKIQIPPRSTNKTKRCKYIPTVA